ncbi:unnamed protein product [Symbiodinium sp. CCMP2592]|nr:unnamed protein product [Symbiodinium sp. CCMP2592]
MERKALPSFLDEVKCIDIAAPISHDEDLGEAYERVGIRLPTGAFTYAPWSSKRGMWPSVSLENIRGIFRVAVSGAGRGEPGGNFDAQLLAVVSCDGGSTQRRPLPNRSEHDPDFQTYGGKKVLYFDVLDDPNIKERRAEIQRCREKGDEQRRRYEEADKKWEEEREQRLLQAQQEEAKPKLSKKAKQKARQALKKGIKPGIEEQKEQVADKADDEANEGEDSEQERLHKQRQAERRAKIEEDLKQEKEQDSHRKKLEMAEAKRQAQEEANRIATMKTLLQKVQSSLPTSAGASSPVMSGNGYAALGTPWHRFCVGGFAGADSCVPLSVPRSTC